MLPLVLLMVADGLYVRLKTALAGTLGDGVWVAVVVVPLALFAAGVAVAWRDRKVESDRPKRLETLLGALVGVGVVLVFDMVDPWLGGRLQIPVVILYLVAALVLLVCRPAVRVVGAVLVVVPAVFATALMAAVGAGWEPVDLAVSLTDQPLSESTHDAWGYLFLVVPMWALAVWTVSVLRYDEVRAYYDGRPLAAPPAVAG